MTQERVNQPKEFSFEEGKLIQILKDKDLDERVRKLIQEGFDVMIVERSNDNLVMKRKAQNPDHPQIRLKIEAIGQMYLFS